MRDFLDKCSEVIAPLYEAVMNPLYEFYYGSKCDSFEKVVMQFMVMMGTTVFLVTVGFAISQINLCVKQIREINSEYEFYLFEDDIKWKKRLRILFSVAAVFFILLFGGAMGILCLLMGVPDDTPYEFWRWLLELLT